MSMAEERWLPIPGYEGLYLVSDHGRVKQVSSGRVLKPYKTGRGHLVIYMVDPVRGKGSPLSLARLALSTFVRKPMGREFAIHLNGDRADNTLENLEWGDRPQPRIAPGEGHWNAKLTEEQVREIRKLGLVEGRERPGSGNGSRAVAARYGVSHVTVQRIWRGQIWTHVVG